MEKSIKMAVFWDVAPCSLVYIDRRFRGATTSAGSKLLFRENTVFENCFFFSEENRHRHREEVGIALTLKSLIVDRSITKPPPI
jgi:hypothetical protein